MSFLLFLSDAMVPLMIFYIVGFGILSGRPVLDDFIRGVKDGVKTVGGIFPTLIGLMVSVGILRSSGLLDAFGELLKAPASFLVLYCMSIYFGSVGIRKTRYTLAGGLLASAVGLAASAVLSAMMV